MSKSTFSTRIFALTYCFVSLVFGFSQTVLAGRCNELTSPTPAVVQQIVDDTGGELSEIEKIIQETMDRLTLDGVAEDRLTIANARLNDPTLVFDGGKVFYSYLISLEGDTQNYGYALVQIKHAPMAVTDLHTFTYPTRNRMQRAAKEKFKVVGDKIGAEAKVNRIYARNEVKYALERLHPAIKVEDIENIEIVSVTKFVEQRKTVSVYRLRIKTWASQYWFRLSVRVEKTI